MNQKKVSRSLVKQRLGPLFAADGTNKDRQWTVRNVIERLAAIRREEIAHGYCGSSRKSPRLNPTSKGSSSLSQSAFVAIIKRPAIRCIRLLNSQLHGKQKRKRVYTDRRRFDFKPQPERPQQECIPRGC